MSTFNYKTFAITVEPVDATDEGRVWQIVVQSSGAKRPLTLMTAGGESEARIALDLLSDLRRIYSIGVESYVKAELVLEPEAEEDDLRKRATALFVIAQGAEDADLAAAQEQLQVEAVPPEEREATEVMNRIMSRSFDFGNVKITVRPHGTAPSGHIWFHVLTETPGGRDEDLIMRPPNYLASRSAQDHFKVIQFVLKDGIPSSVARHMKANYLSEEWRPQTQEYIERMDRFGRLLGAAEIDRIVDAFEEEAEREAEERMGILKQYTERAEVGALEDLRRREAELVARIKELRAEPENK